jgi:hypothetical protein
VLALLRRRDAVATAALAVVLGVFGYALFVGGDFMAMGRFLVPALPFLTVAFASALASVIALSWRALASSTALVAACVALSLFAAFDVYAVPSSFRKSFRFRWNTDDWLTEYGQWGMMRAQASRWRLLGRALAAKTQPGESLVFGTIGAVGYYSDMTILDPYGLVSREPFEELDPAVRRSPGHQRRIALSTYLAKNPTYLEAQIVDRNERYAGLRRDLVAGGAYADVSAPEWLEIQDVPGAQRNQVLRLVRYRPR